MDKEAARSIIKETLPQSLENQAPSSIEAMTDVLDSIAALVYIADLKTYEVLFANKYLQESMGVVPGQLCWKSIQRSSGPCGFCPNEKLLTPNGVPGASYRWEQFNTVDKRWYDTIDRAIIWIDGRLVRLSVATDITDRKKMEESLQETNEKLNTLLKNSPDVIQVIDHRYNIIYTNEIMKESSTEAKLGTSIFESMQEGYHEKFRLTFKRVIEKQESVSFEYAGDKGRWWESEIAPITSHSDHDCVMMINRDISNRKQVEESLIETNRKLNTLLKNSPDTVLVIDKDLNILYSNLVVKSSMEDSHQKNVLDNVASEYHDSFKQMFWRVVKNRVTSSIEFQDIHQVWWESRAAQITINLDTECAMLINRNITNRKKVESYMKEAQYELECRIKERTAQLEQTYQQLIQRDKLATLGFLVSSIAHEINNPNSFISFNIPILQDYIADILPILDQHAKSDESFEVCGIPYDDFRSDVINLLDNMKHGSQRISETVANLRDFIGAQQENDFKVVALKRIVEKGVELCRSKVNNLVESFTVEMPEENIEISTIAQSLEQILINLLINAAQSSDKQESWVKLTVDDKECKSGWICIEVRDNGCGIEPDNLPKIFDPFFTTKKQQSGLGLGLNITKKLADEIGCTLEVDSEPNVGSCFRLLVPVQK